jgi:DNA primase small subunit
MATKASEISSTMKGNDESAEEVTTASSDTPSNSTTKMVVTPHKKPTPQNHVFSPELLKLYYGRLFPYSLLGSWLSYSNNNSVNKIFSHREFSFTLEPLPGEEIYIRYQSFATPEELQKAIQRRQPHKIDIGAVFTHPPKDKQAYSSDVFHPVQRELVFDIDLTDYDDIRQCGCTGANICNKCWTYMTMAVKVMDQGLKEDFGFQHVAWFYSGRRGVHAWVCDEEARFLTNQARSAVANYFEVSERLL